MRPPYFVPEYKKLDQLLNQFKREKEHAAIVVNEYGDAFEYGTSGVWINQSIPNTDPALGAYKTLTARRVIYYEPPGHEGFMAQEYLNAVSPLTAASFHADFASASDSRSTRTWSASSSTSLVRS